MVTGSKGGLPEGGFNFNRKVNARKEIMRDYFNPRIGYLERRFINKALKLADFTCFTMSFPETARCAPDLSVHCLIQWFYCRRSLHSCARYPFGLLVKTERDVSGRGVMVVKLLLCFVFCLTY